MKKQYKPEAMLTKQSYDKLRKDPTYAKAKAGMHKATESFAKYYSDMIKAEPANRQKYYENIEHVYASALYFFIKMLSEQKAIDPLADPSKNTLVFLNLFRHDNTHVFMSNTYDNDIGGYQYGQLLFAYRLREIFTHWLSAAYRCADELRKVSDK